MRAAVALLPLALALAPLVAPAAAVADTRTCDLSPASPVCEVACRPFTRLGVEAPPGARVAARCGLAEVACEDGCRRTSLLPALVWTGGECVLEHGPRGRCVASMAP